MKVRVKKVNPEIPVVLPGYAKSGDAGIDLIATSVEGLQTLPCGSKIMTYGTNLAFEIPDGYVGLLFPRSSISKTSLSLCNAVGVVDSGYRGEVKFKFRIDANSRPVDGQTYKVGDRIGQIMILPYPQIELQFSETLSSTERGDGGFGSSGK